MENSQLKEYDYESCSPLLSKESLAAIDALASSARANGTSPEDVSKLREREMTTVLAKAFRVLKLYRSATGTGVECEISVKSHPGATPTEKNLTVPTNGAVNGSEGSTASRLPSGTPVSSGQSAHGAAPVGRASDWPDAGVYAALTYTWSHDDSCVVYIYHKSVRYQKKIGSNLHSALVALRRSSRLPPTQSLDLWVDSLCIDQASKEEKTAQLPLCSDVYRYATNVVIWLGPQENDSDIAMEFLAQCLESCTFDTLFGLTYSKQWEAIFSLMRRRWFGRRWIVQEIAYAKQADVVVQCGDRHAKWTDLRDVLSMLLERKPDLQSVFTKSEKHSNNNNYTGDLAGLPAIRLARVVGALFRRKADGGIRSRVRSLEAIISMLADFDATNPRDYIYAILSLPHDALATSMDAFGAHGFDAAASRPTSPTQPDPGARSSTTKSFSERGATGLTPQSREDRNGLVEMGTNGISRLARLASSHINIATSDTMTTSATGARSRQGLTGNDSSFTFPEMPGCSPVELPDDTETTPPVPQELRVNWHHIGNDPGTVLPTLDALTDTASDAEGTRPEQRGGKQKAVALVVGAFKNKRFPVDYRKKVFEICKDALAFVVQRTGSLDLLCTPWAPNDKELDDAEEERLPSWMPRRSGSAFRLDPSHRSHRVNADPLVGIPGLTSKMYSASGSTKAKWIVPAKEGRCLVVSGRIMDTIRSTEQPAIGGMIPAGWAAAGGWTNVRQIPPDAFWQTLVGNRDPKDSSQNQEPPPHWQRMCMDAWSHAPEYAELNIDRVLVECGKMVHRYLERVKAVIWGKQLVTFDSLPGSKDGSCIGLAPGRTQNGDLVCLVKGCSVPVVLRTESPKPGAAPDSRQHYGLIGECYVHGMMDNEAMQYCEERKIRWEELYLS